MCEMTGAEWAYAVAALAVQAVMCLHFALRRWRFQTAIRYGPVVYALGLPLAGLSVALWRAGLEPWYWVGGLLYLVWGAFGLAVEYGRGIRNWRAEMRWPVLVPYVVLYLATMMLFWWPLARVCPPLWSVAAALFVVGTALNVASHRDRGVGDMPAGVA